MDKGTISFRKVIYSKIMTQSPCSFYKRLPFRITVRDSYKKWNMYISVDKSYLTWFLISELVMKQMQRTQVRLQDWGLSKCHGTLPPPTPPVEKMSIKMNESEPIWRVLLDKKL